MNILVTGASGLVGGKLVPKLTSLGHDVFKLSRSAPKDANEIQWNAKSGFSTGEAAKLEGIGAVIHLAGDNVAGSSWTETKKKSIRDSRIEGTRNLVDAFRAIQTPPTIFISASAIGFYGNRGDEKLSEESEKGSGFFPELCGEWEAEAFKAEELGARVVCPRIGIVLSKDGGALGKMLLPFKFGVGGVIGSGDQYMSWISIDDLVALIIFALQNDEISGVINATAPNPVTNREFTKTLGNVLGRPTILPVPSFGIKLLFGEMGEKLILEGCRVFPKKLEDAGFSFEYQNLKDALSHEMKN